MAAVADRASGGGSGDGRFLLNIPPPVPLVPPSSKKLVSSAGAAAPRSPRSPRSPPVMIGMAVVAEVEEVSSRGSVRLASGAWRAPASYEPPGPGIWPQPPGDGGGVAPGWPPKTGGMAGDDGGP
jgi:hypothetical protein